MIGELGLKPRNAYAPLRVAITGRTVSPPLFESMELLGRERSMSRLRRAAASVRLGAGRSASERFGWVLSASDTLDQRSGKACPIRWGMG